MIEKTRNEQTDALCKAFASLKTVEECYKFLDDLCTLSEVTEMGKRLSAARMLREGIFRYNTDRDILYRTAETTKLLGMCVEIEINIADNPVDVARYKEYLGVGAETGYMNAVKVYYQGGLPGEFYKAYLSDNKYTNSVYHDTYAFAKGTFSEETQSGIDEIVGCDDMELECRAGSGVSGQLEIDTEASYSVKLAVSPKYGAVRLNADGSFSYTSRKGFDVTDTFYVYADYGYGLSDPIAITVHVNP